MRCRYRGLSWLSRIPCIGAGAARVPSLSWRSGCWTQLWNPLGTFGDNNKPQNQPLSRARPDQRAGTGPLSIE